MVTRVVCAGAKLQQNGRSDTAMGVVALQFGRKQHKVIVFKARGAYHSIYVESTR